MAEYSAKIHCENSEHAQKPLNKSAISNIPSVFDWWFLTNKKMRATFGFAGEESKPLLIYYLIYRRGKISGKNNFAEHKNLAKPD